MLKSRHWRSVATAFLLLVSTLTAGAKEPAKANAGVKWAGDLTAAREAAREQHRPLLLFVTMDGCVHCQKMKQTTLRDKDVQRDLQASFVPVALNAKDAPELVKSLHLRLFPAVVVLQPNGSVLESISGYQSAKQLREKLSATTRQAARNGDQRTQR